MNWTNYRALVNHLETMDRSRFDYGDPCPTFTEDPCCLACQCAFVESGMMPLNVLQGASKISDWLGVTWHESKYLYGADEQTVEPVNTLDPDYAMDLEGEMGIREAIRRLSVVAARYGGEPAQVEPANHEQQFLADVRSLAQRVIAGQVDAH